MKNKTFIAAMSVAGTLSVLGIAAASTGSLALDAQNTPHVCAGNHYSELSPRHNRSGHKEFWVCCSCHQHFLAKPTTGTWNDTTLNPNIDPGEILGWQDDRLIKMLYPFTDEAFKPKGVSASIEPDGTIIYKNGTSGLLAGDNQNWGESGLRFLDLWNGVQATANQYLKFDVNFESGSTGFNLRFGNGGSGDTDYWINHINFDSVLPNGREVNVFDTNGKRVETMIRNTWYTMYVKITCPDFNAIWTNGGSLANPAITKFKNVTLADKLPTSVSPYFKESKGTVELSKEPGFEGAYKVTKGDPNPCLVFRGITHTASTGGKEYAGGFFDDAANEYFVLDYFVQPGNTLIGLETGGEGFGQAKGRYVGKQSKDPDARIFSNGQEVQTLQDGWNTIEFHVSHGQGGWTDFYLNFEGNTSYFKNIRYSTTKIA